MADYDRLIAEREPFSELERGRMSGDSDGWANSADVRARFAEWPPMPAEVVWSPMSVADLDVIWEWIAVENGVEDGTRHYR